MRDRILYTQDQSFLYSHLPNMVSFLFVKQSSIATDAKEYSIYIYTSLPFLWFRPHDIFIEPISRSLATGTTDFTPQTRYYFYTTLGLKSPNML